MKEKLPVDIENLDLPEDNFKQSTDKKGSYGFASILYLLGLIITFFSLLTVILIGK